MTDAVKKPTNRWAKKKKEPSKNVEESDSSFSNSIDPFDSEENAVSLDNLLFYSPRIAQTIDDKEVFEYVNLAYPAFNRDFSEKELRKDFLNFLNETSIVENILEKYSYTMEDLISLFCRRMPYLFSTKTYINKIREIIEENYAN